MLYFSRFKKLVFIHLLIIILIISLFVAWPNINDQPNYAQAGFESNIYGWAWNDTVGWISFNSLNCDQDNNGYIDSGDCGGDNATTPIVNYGVNVDNLGNFSGYAWNDNVGYIWFAPTDTPPGETAPNPVYLDFASGQVSGWARICSKADDPVTCTGNNGLGWLKMSGSTYGVTYDSTNSDFHNYAYSDEIGWVSFNCAEGGNPPGVNICGTSQYKVSKCQVYSNSSISGWAWSENIGWISFDCANDCSCQNVEYGVNADNEGKLSGYAWSSNVGWISFEKVKVCDNDHSIVCTNATDCVNAGVGGDCSDDSPPDSYAFNVNCDSGVTCDSSNNCTACYNHADNKVYGWAKVLSMGDDGWISLNSANCDIDNNGYIDVSCGGDNSTDSVYSYEVSVQNGEEFVGWAWDGNTTLDTGIGWISFNSATDGSAFEYKVVTKISTQTLTASAGPSFSSPCNQIKVIWNDVDGEAGYNIYRSITNGFTPNDSNLAGTVGADATNFTDIGLNPGTTYYYIVRAVGGIGYKDSNQTQATTDPVCQVEAEDNNSLIGQCPNHVQVDWKEPINNCTIDYYEVARCQCSNTTCPNCSVTNPGDDDPDGGGDFAVINDSGNDCNQPTTDKCIDSVDSSARKETFKYSVRAHCNTGEYGLWSDAFDSDGVIPCPQRPSWIEQKPE